MTHRIYPALVLLLLAGVAWYSIASADEPKRTDLEKGRIEGPLKKALGDLPKEAVKGGAVRVDVGKYDIELPAKLLVRGASPAKARRPSAPPPSQPADEAAAAPADRKAVVDQGKRRIELPVKRALAAKVPEAERLRETKKAVENPTKAVVAKTSSGFENPKVEPGKVRWHKDFETACAAAKKSGRPVLLFPMMGKLDDRFC